MNYICSVCGKDMLAVNGSSTIQGVTIGMRTDDSTTPEYKKFLEEQIAPFRLNVDYSVCLGCWLLSLGVKPEVENEKD